METTLRAYCFDTHRSDERAAWSALQARLLASHPHCMHSHGGASHWLERLDGATVTLETQHVFDNQWNTAPIPGDSNAPTGRRVFDWALDFEPSGNYSLMRGHYLDQTDAMRETRANRRACGYCGHQYTLPDAPNFCGECMGSEYLKASELHLLRVRGVGLHTKREPLTDAERAQLLPLYREAQLHGISERDKTSRKRERTHILDAYDAAGKKYRLAATERDGMLWLHDHGIRTANIIFYSHTGRFCFGWRDKADPEFVSALLEVVSEFPFPYDIKCHDGRTLSGG